MKLDLLVAGDLLVDILAPIGELKKGDSVFSDIKVKFGGAAGNTAVWASRLGLRVGLIGKVGNDCYGEEYISDLKREGVKPIIYKGKKPTGICISLIHPDGDRTLIALRGANDEITIEDVRDALSKAGSYRLIYLQAYSYHSEKPGEAYRLLLEEAVRKNAVAAINASSASLLSQGKNRYIELFRMFDILILNLDEAEALTGERNMEKAAIMLGEIVDEVVVTMGKDGCLAYDGHKMCRVKAVKPDRIVDTTGAGDAFAAGYLAARIRRLDIYQAAKEGCKIAAKAISIYGGR